MLIIGTSRIAILSGQASGWYRGRMSSLFTDTTYLQYQYGDSEKLKIRIETHQRYTAGDDDFYEVELSHIAAEAGMAALDVGCGTGRLSGTMRDRGVRYVGLDASAGLLKEARQNTGGQFIQGDAHVLPIPDEQFDRVVAFGVLYHLADWRQTLREMRRVVRPGGRVVVSTNGADAMKRIYDVHREAALELGYTPLPFGSPAFRLENLDEVRAVFPTVQRHIRKTALVFPDPEPALRFYATNRIDMIEGWQTSTEHRARLLPLVRSKIEAIIRQEGAFRVPKNYGYFVADV
jgi:ubiquinone/menaquinone biosynthesis C-methylase UbiE